MISSFGREARRSRARAVRIGLGLGPPAQRAVPTRAGDVIRVEPTVFDARLFAGFRVRHADEREEKVPNHEDSAEATHLRALEA